MTAQAAALDAAIFQALEATWPPVRWHTADGWRVGEGAGGGQRVSAGIAQAPVAKPADLAQAQRGLGQVPLAMVRQGADSLDAALAEAGWTVRDPTVALAAPVGNLAETPPRLTAFEVTWPPLAIQAEIWAAGGIGPARIAVMERAAVPKISLLGRVDDRPAATAFVACDGPLAMVHALEVLPERRRARVGWHLMQAAALWAARMGAESLAVLVTRANAPAVALYRALGMVEITSYHYRALETPDAGTA